MRLRYCQFLKEHQGHIVIVVLAGMKDCLFQPINPSERSRHHGGFDELGPGADYSYDFHGRWLVQILASPELGDKSTRYVGIRYAASILKFLVITQKFAFVNHAQFT